MLGLLILILVLGFPMAEIIVLLKVGHAIGFWNTVFLLFFSAALGVQLARHQGMSALLKIQQCLQEGRAPASEMLDGILIFTGGVLFVIPGFISDGLGLLLIFPPTRWLIKLMLGWSAKAGTTRSPQSSNGPQKPKARPSFPPASRGPVKDADIVE